MNAAVKKAVITIQTKWRESRRAKKSYGVFKEYVKRKKAANMITRWWKRRLVNEERRVNEAATKI